MLERILAFDIDVFAVFLLLTMLFILRVKGDRHSYSGGLFRIIIHLTILALILEPMTWISDMSSGPVASFFNYLSNFLLVLIGPILIGYWISYVDYKVMRNRHRVRRLCYYQYSTFLIAALLVVNFLTPVFFTVSETNDYTAGPLMFLAPAIMFIHMVYAAALLIRNRHRTNIGVIRGVMAFFILPAIGVVIQMLDPAICFAWPMLALVVVVTYVFLETTSGTLDTLTNLYSRAKFDDYLAFLKENSDLFGLLMIDLDDFKGINDTFGHQAGDLVLTEFATILKGVFRSERMVARIGGDEFMVVTAHDATAAAKGVEEVRKKLRSVRNNDALKNLGFSFGFIQNDPELTADTLLSKVDHRMYDDKAGKKRQAPTAS